MKDLLLNGSPQIAYEVNYLRLPSDIQVKESATRTPARHMHAKDNLALSFEVVLFLFSVSAFSGA